MPRRTLSPRISTTVMTMSLLMTIDSFFFLDSTSIGVYLSVSEISGWWLRHQPPHSIPSAASPHASARSTDGRSFARLSSWQPHPRQKENEEERSSAKDHAY